MSDGRDQVCTLPSRVGNFLAVGLPHRLGVFHDAAISTVASTHSHKMALVAYRNLLRSARIAFQGTLPTTFEIDWILIAMQAT
jgi:hypothetical protein